MAQGQACVNCNNFDSTDSQDPKCTSNCPDFKKQLMSGQCTTCKIWEVKVA